MRKLAILTLLAVIIIKHRRRPMPHVSVFTLVGNEHARLVYMLSQRHQRCTCNDPKTCQVSQWNRNAIVTGLMHLAGNRPSIKAG